MGPTKHHRTYLFINALLYVVFGIWCAVDPHGTATAVGFTLPGAQGVAEYTAVYGGLEFGVGVFFFLAARSLDLWRAGIIFGACFYTALFLFRTFAITQVGFDIGAGVNFYLAEGLFTAWSLFLLRGIRTQPTSLR
jgi:hypothetical protein